MRNIRQWVSVNFDPADYHDSMYQCVYQGQLNYYLTQGYSTIGAANAAQGYADDPTKFVQRTKDFWEFYM
jgi:hypothetical protein